jgi:large subunit ribosomal protein L15
MKNNAPVEIVDLSSLKPAAGSHRPVRRRGRGTSAGQGRTCGKGHKGQKSRAGYHSSPGFEGGQMPIQRRLPKRGFTNDPFRKVYQIVNLTKLNDIFAAGQEVTPAILHEKGLIAKLRVPVKILGDGEISIPLKMQVHAASKSAIEKIQAAGGEVQLLC